MTATVGTKAGSTHVYTGGTPADLYNLNIEEVLLSHTDAGAHSVTEVANVHYPGTRECGPVQIAKLEPGRRMLLVLSAPGPDKPLWTVDGAAAAFDLSESPDGHLVATWQHTTPSCDGHLQFTVTALISEGPATTATPGLAECIAS